MFIFTDLNNLGDIIVHSKEVQHCKIYLDMHIPTVQMSNLPTVFKEQFCSFPLAYRVSTRLANIFSPARTLSEALGKL